MRRIICALIIAGIAFALSACNSEPRLKIKGSAVEIADLGV